MPRAVVRGGRVVTVPLEDRVVVSGETQADVVRHPEVNAAAELQGEVSLAVIDSDARRRPPDAGVITAKERVQVRRDLGVAGREPDVRAGQKIEVPEPGLDRRERPRGGRADVEGLAAEVAVDVALDADVLVEVARR